LSIAPSQSVLLKYRRSNSLGKRKKKKEKEMPSTVMTAIEQKPRLLYTHTHSLTRRQGADEGKLSLYDERMKKNRDKKRK